MPCSAIYREPKQIKIVQLHVAAPFHVWDEPSAALALHPSMYAHRVVQDNMSRAAVGTIACKAYISTTHQLATAGCPVACREGQRRAACGVC